jgi:hypothetical protein
MLSGVLRSKRAVAVKVNIEIMRAFVRLRQLLSTHRELAQKLAELEHRIGTHDEQIQMVFEAIRQLMTPAEPNKRKIGFLAKERAARYRWTISMFRELSKRGSDARNGVNGN